MPKRESAQRIQCRHFSWLLRRRGQAWQADGRGNSLPLGRHSLGTADHQEAVKLLERLDLNMAVKFGLAPPMPEQTAVAPLFLEEGARLYLKHAGRSRVSGGVRPLSLKRYRTAVEKFCVYAKGTGLSTWNEVRSRTLEDYAARLESEGYAYRSQYWELTTLKQVIGWFNAESHLPATTTIRFRLRKPSGT